MAMLQMLSLALSYHKQRTSTIVYRLFLKNEGIGKIIGDSGGKNNPIAYTIVR
jgi:predicted RNA-binding protein YlqC (UPF0109 family)